MTDQNYPRIAIPIDKLDEYFPDTVDLEPDQGYIHAVELPRTLARQRIYGDIDQERVEQDAQWGGPGHDDEHDPFVWLGIVGKHFGLYAHEVLTLNEGLAQLDATIRRSDAVTVAQELKRQVIVTRQQVVRLAAICVAQLEAIDRAEGA